MLICLQVKEAGSAKPLQMVELRRHQITGCVPEVRQLKTKSGTDVFTCPFVCDTMFYISLCIICHVGSAVEPLGSLLCRA